MSGRGRLRRGGARRWLTHAWRRAVGRLVGLALAAVVLLLRLTCRRRVVGECRPALRAAGEPYVYALLHAHQVGAVLVSHERGLAAMVSRSADGDLLVPSLRLRGVVPVRGSTRSATVDKGGRAALAQLAACVAAGAPALIAVDGPRGPRGRVHRGVVALARRTGAAILPIVVTASRRWILGRSWDRLQIPTPGSQLCLALGPPIRLDGQSDAAALAAVGAALAALEAREDPAEAARAAAAPSPATAPAATAATAARPPATGQPAA